MLSTLLASTLLLAGHVMGQQCTGMSGGKSQAGNNYVVDIFSETLLFSYAINQCTGGHLIDSGVYYKYTCSQDDDDMWWVTKSSYSTSDCTGDAIGSEVWGETDAEPGEIGYFQCDGKNSYATIKISVDTECGSPATVVGGLGGCASNPAIFDTKFYCDSTSALVQLYANPTTTSSNYTMCDDDHLYCAKWTFPTTCTFATQFAGQTVYGYMTECFLSESETTTTESSASSQFTLVGIVIALIAGLFH